MIAGLRTRGPIATQPIERVEEDCVDSKHVEELSQHLECTWNMLMTPGAKIPLLAKKIHGCQTSKTLSVPCTREFAVPRARRGLELHRSPKLARVRSQWNLALAAQLRVRSQWGFVLVAMLRVCWRNFGCSRSEAEAMHKPGEHPKPRLHSKLRCGHCRIFGQHGRPLFFSGPHGRAHLALYVLELSCQVPVCA